MFSSRFPPWGTIALTLPTSYTTYLVSAPKITPNDGVLNFETMSAPCIYNLYRGLVGIVPLITNWMGLQVSLHGISLRTVSQLHLTQFVGFTKAENSSEDFNSSSNCSCVPGQIFFDRKLKHIVVGCKGESFVSVDRVAPYRKKSMSALEFYNGYLSKQPKILWHFRNKWLKYPYEIFLPCSSFIHNLQPPRFRCNHIDWCTADVVMFQCVQGQAKL